jgi:hypothetical protein
MSQTEGNYNLEFLLSEAPGGRSREAGVLLSGQDLAAGTVVGKITKAQAAAPIPTIVGTGTGAMTALTFGPAVQTGSYVITLTATSSTAAFTVVAPDGVSLIGGNVGTAYVSEHLSFLISNGGTMTTGDVFTVVVTASGTPVLVGTGTGTVSGVTLGPQAQLGTYRVQLLATSATAEFEVIAPDGSKLKRGQVATAYTSSHVNFTLANGGTMTSGDYFSIIVANGSGKFVAHTPLTYDGRNDPFGVICAAGDASSGDIDCTVICRDAEVFSDRLTWAATVSAGDKLVGATKLDQQRGIVVR